MDQQNRSGFESKLFKLMIVFPLCEKMESINSITNFQTKSDASLVHLVDVFLLLD